MPNYAGGASICPFYSHESDKSITCEGFSDTHKIALKFTSKQAKLNWLKDYCMTFDFRRCPLAECLYSTFEED